MQEQEQTIFMHHIALGKGEGFSHKTRQALPQRVVPTLNMIGLPTAFAARPMLLLGQHSLIAVPKVGIEQAALVGSRNALPEQAAGRFTAVAQGIRHHLAGATAQG